MARSGDFPTSNKYIVYWIEAIQNSQSVSGNYSNVTVRVWVRRTNTGYTTYGSGTVYCTINGSTYSASLTSSHKITSRSLKIFEKTLNIGHNSDGTKTLGMSARIQHSQFSSSTHSWSMSLTTIPRASVPTLSSGTITMGNSLTIYTNRKSSSFTHTVRYTFGKLSGTIATGVGTSTTWTVPLSLANQIPNSVKGYGHIFVDTYNGGTKIGSNSVRFYAQVPSNVKPSLSHIYHEDTNTTVKNAIGSYVQGLSTIKITIPASGITLAYGSPIKSYKIYWGRSLHKGTIGTFDIKNSGSHTIRAEIVDSRGRVGTYTTTVNVSAYQPPKIDRFSVERVNSDGSPNSTGTYAAVHRQGTWSTLGGKNNVTIRVLSKPRNSSSWSEVHSTTGTTGTFGNTIVLEGYEVIKSYDFRVEVADLFNTTLSLYNLSTGQVTMSWGPEGVGIGKVWESGTLDVSGDIYEDGVRLEDKYTPAGVIQIFAGSTAPNGWLLCEGQEVSRTTYKRLFDVIGTTYGAGNGSTTFNLPDLRGRVPVGFNSRDSSFNALNKKGGAKTHTLSEDEMPRHQHSLGNYNSGGQELSYTPYLTTHASNVGFSGNIRTDFRGGGEAHNNLQPYITLKFIIKT